MTVTQLPEPLTRSVEDYLKAIYRLSSGGHPVSTSQIAELLALSAPSVSGMIRRLSEQGLLEHVPYRGVLLTAAGRRVALRMVRRHRLIEAYLVGQLGYSWDTVHEEAERLEHAVSALVEERLYRTLGGPKTCPHGNPIPGHSTMRANELRLSALRPGDTGTITRISEVAQREAPPLLQYLHERGLHPGTRITVEEVDEIGRTMRLRAARQLTLSYETASKLSVVRSTKPRSRRVSAPH